MRPAGIASACVLVAIVSSAGCGGSETTFDEPNGVVVWSTDEQPPLLPADSPARDDPTMFVDQLVEATVYPTDEDHVVVVGDAYDPDDSGSNLDEQGVPHRFAYALDADGRMLQLLGALEGDSTTYSGIPGRRLGAGLDRSASSARLFSSLGTRPIPVYVDPSTGQVFTFAIADEGEVLYGIHGLDDAGRVTNIVGIAP